MRSKDFAGWHSKKASLQARISYPHFSEREVWWTAIGINVGDEEDGKGANFSRPVLVLRKFNQHFFYGVPLTSQIKSGPYYELIKFDGGISTVLLSHMRDYDGRRLIRKYGVVTEPDFVKTQQAILSVIARQNPKV